MTVNRSAAARVVPARRMSVCASEAGESLLRGAAILTELLGRTLGPHGASVVASAPDGDGRPQLLTRAGTIARRIIEISDPFENMGMLIARHAACATDAQVADGVATTAVLFEHLLRNGLRLIAAGYSTPTLVDEIVVARDHLSDSLRAAVLPIDPFDAVTAVVRQSVDEADLAAEIIRAAEGVGHDGWVETRPAYGTRPELEFVEGLRFVGQTSVGPAPAQTLRLRTGGRSEVLVCGEPIVDLGGVGELIERLVATGSTSLLIIAPTISDAVRDGVASLPSDAPACVFTAEVGATAGAEVLADIAAYVGTRVVSRVAGDCLASLPLAGLGSVQRVWATSDEFGFVGSAGRKAAVERARVLRRQRETQRGRTDQAALSRRIAALSGSVAVLSVPNGVEAEAAERDALVSATVRAAQYTLGSGVVAGGGAALAVADVGPATLGALALRDAAAEPLRRIAARAGLEPGAILEQTRGAAAGSRLDALHQVWLDRGSTEVVDPFAVVDCALRTAVSAAITAMTSEVLVRRTRPVRSVNP